VKITTEEGEEVVAKAITEDGRIWGLKKYAGRKAMIVILKAEDEKKGEEVTGKR